MSRRLRLACLLAVAACGPSEVPALVAVEPARGLTDRETAIVLRGRGLALDFEDDGEGVRAAAWSGRAGERDLRAVTWRSPSTIEAVVPPGLAPGAYEIVLQRGDLAVRLAGAFVAVAPALPRIDDASPLRIPLDGGVVRVQGAGLHLGSSARVRGTDAPARWLGDEALEIVAPPGAEGPARLEVVTPVGRAVRDDLLFHAPAM